MQLFAIFNPGKELATRLRDLGIAVCADVAGDHGTPCPVGVTVETNGCESWSGHAPVARSGEESVEENVDIMFRKQILNRIESLERNMRQSLPAARKEHTINDIIRLSVRLTYSIQQDRLPNLEVVRRHNRETFVSY